MKELSVELEERWPKYLGSACRMADLQMQIILNIGVEFSQCRMSWDNYSSSCAPFPFLSPNDQQSTCMLYPICFWCVLFVRVWYFKKTKKQNAECVCIIFDAFDDVPCCCKHKSPSLQRFCLYAFCTSVKRLVQISFPILEMPFDHLPLERNINLVQ